MNKNVRTAREPRHTEENSSEGTSQPSALRRRLSREPSEIPALLPPSMPITTTALIVLLAAVFLLQTELRAGDLDDYVRREESSFQWNVQSKQTFDKLGTGYHVRLTSQTWKNTTWKHNLRLLVPKGAEEDVPVFLVVTGGDGDWKPLKIAAQFTQGSGYALALLGNVPNQPLFGDLHEDDLIAHTFVKFLESGDTSWPLLFPMTKSVVGAMDAIDQLAASRMDHRFSGYVVGGSSKRGWTSWLTGAVDQRVNGMIPMVFDNLKVRKQMKNQLETWGDYTSKIEPYTKRDIPEKLRSERGRKLVRLVDPYTYRNRYDVPTLMISGTNDAFWPLNSVNLFIDDMKHEIHQLYLPNTGHGVGSNFMNVAKTIRAFLLRVTNKLTFPLFRASAKREGNRVKFSLSTEEGPDPDSAHLWVARHDNRDFRDAKWKDTKLNPGTKTHSIDPKSASHLACFARLSFSVNGNSFQLTSRVFLFSFGNGNE